VKNHLLSIASLTLMVFIYFDSAIAQSIKKADDNNFLNNWHFEDWDNGDLLYWETSPQASQSEAGEGLIGDYSLHFGHTFQGPYSDDQGFVHQEANLQEVTYFGELLVKGSGDIRLGILRPGYTIHDYGDWHDIDTLKWIRISHETIKDDREGTEGNFRIQHRRSDGSDSTNLFIGAAWLSDEKPPEDWPEPVAGISVLPDQVYEDEDFEETFSLTLTEEGFVQDLNISDINLGGDFNGLAIEGIIKENITEASLDLSGNLIYGTGEGSITVKSSGLNGDDDLTATVMVNKLTDNFIINWHFDGWDDNKPFSWDGSHAFSTNWHKEEEHVFVGLYSVKVDGGGVRTLSQTGEDMVAEILTENDYYAKVWIKGTGEAEVGIEYPSGYTSWSEKVILDNDDWTPITHHATTTSTVGDNGGIEIRTTDDGGTTPGETLYLGAAWLADQPPPPDWPGETPISAIIDPTETEYDLDDPGDVMTTITWNDASTVIEINDGSDFLTENEDYMVICEGETAILTLLDTYLENVLIENEDYVVLDITFDEGENAGFTVTAIKEVIPVNFLKNWHFEDWDNGDLLYWETSAQASQSDSTDGFVGYYALHFEHPFAGFYNDDQCFVQQESDMQELNYYGEIWVKGYGDIRIGIQRPGYSTHSYSQWHTIDTHEWEKVTHQISKDDREGIEGNLRIQHRRSDNKDDTSLLIGAAWLANDPPSEGWPENILPLLLTKPEDGDIDVKPDANVILKFGKNIQEGPGEFSSISFVDENEKNIEFTTSIDNNVLIIIPDENLDYLTEHIVTIPADAIADADDDNVVMEKSVIICFTTKKQTTFYVVNFGVKGGIGTLKAKVDDIYIETGDKVKEGSDVLFIATPGNNYKVKEWKVNDLVIEDYIELTYFIEKLGDDIDVKVEFEKYVGNQDFIKPYVRFYPNPVFNKAIVESSKKIKHIRLININGQIVKEIHVDGSHAKIIVAGVKAGIYFMQIHTIEGIVTQRLQILN